MAESKYTLGEWEDLGSEEQRKYNLDTFGIETTYRIRRQAFVPSAVRGRPFSIRS